MNSASDGTVMDDLNIAMDEVTGRKPTCEYPLKPTPKFGPDGTWNTPFCKGVDGCLHNEQYCPNGCNGMALWQNWNTFRPELSKTTRHFISCYNEGRNYGGVPG